MLDLNVERDITRDCTFWKEVKRLNRSHIPTDCGLQLESFDIFDVFKRSSSVNAREANQTQRGSVKGPGGVDEWKDLMRIEKKHV